MMRKQSLIATLAFALLASCVTPETASTQTTIAEAPTDNPMIHASGTKIVDGNGKPIKLRGVLLEGWLMWNGSLWGAGLTSETTMTERLEALVGKEETARFREKVYESFITEKDIEAIAKLGFNVVRIPFNHTILEDDDKPYVYKDSGWRYLDRVIDWCEKNKVYAVLDLHSLPGGQSIHFVSDPEIKKVWDSEKNMKRTVALWQAIAKRYRDREIVAGYDLINEPGPPNGEALIKAYVRIIAAIRKVDKHHMIILEGTELASDFSMFKKRLDPNQALSFHSYNFFGNDIGKSNLEKLTKMSNKMNVPLWNGEFGAHTAEWVTKAVEYYEGPDNNVNGWVFWPWKNVIDENLRDRFRPLMEIKSTPKWDKVRLYTASLFGWGKKPSKKDTLQGMEEFLEAVKAENLVLDQRTLSALGMGKKAK